MPLHYLFLAIAIASEILATSALKACEGFSKPLPLLIVVVGYVSAFYFLSLVLRSMPLGIAYAIWSGVGIVVLALIGVFFYKQPLDIPAIVGISLILTGVVVLNVFSKSVSH